MKIPVPLKVLLKDELNESFTKLLQYNNYIESYLDNELKKHNEETAKLIADEVDEDIYYDHIFNTMGSFNQLYNTFPNLLRSSNLTNILCVFEIALKDYCENYAYNHNIKLTLRDLRGASDFEKIKIFLTKIVKINFDNINKEWNYIDNCRIVRNKFVHHQGITYIVDNDFKKINQFITENTDVISIKIKNNELGIIKLEKLFPAKLIDCIFKMIDNMDI